MALVAKMKYDEDFGEGNVIGTLGFVSLKEIPEDKLSPQDIEYQNTHSLSFTIHGLNKSGDPKKEKDSVWFAVGKIGNVRDGAVTRKDTEGNWQQFIAGADVRFKFTKNGDYNNVKLKDVVITQASSKPKAAPAEQGGAPATGTKRKFDDTGVKKGHLATCVESILGAKAYDDGDKYTETAVGVQSLTEKVKAQLKSQKPDMSEYDLGATAGRAVKEACNHCKTLKSAEAFAMSAIAPDVDELLTSIVKGLFGQESQEPAQKAEAPQEPSIDFDEDIPFAPIGLQYNNAWIHCV